MIKYVTLLLYLATLTVHASTNELNSTEILKIKNMNGIFKKPAISIKKAIDKGEYYFLLLEQKNKRGVKKLNAFAYKKTGAIYIGSRYESNGIKMRFPAEEALVKEGISFSYGKGKKHIYIVTDPECPYCIKLEKGLHGKLDDYTVHVILYPLRFHKKAPAMVEWIMQGKNDKEKKERMDRLMLEKSKEYQVFMAKKGEIFKYSNEVRNKYNKSVLSSRELGVTGTPSVYDGSFNKINWKTLINTKKKSK